MDELVFNPQPAAIVNPDPVVMYDIVLPAPPVDESTLTGMPIHIGYAVAQSAANFEAAKKRLREDALSQMREKCKSAPVDQKSYCYLSVVSDFYDLIDKKELESLCNGETTGFERRVCLSIAKTTPRNALHDHQGKSWWHAHSPVVESGNLRSRDGTATDFPG